MAKIGISEFSAKNNVCPLGIEGYEEGDVVGAAVFPGGGDAQVCQHPGHGEVKAGVPNEQEGPVDSTPHQPQKALPDSGSRSVGHLTEGSFVLLYIATSLQWYVYSLLYLNSHGRSVRAPRSGPDARGPDGDEPPQQTDHVADQQAGAVAPFTGPVVRSQVGVL